MATYDSKHLLDPELIGIPSNPAAAPSVTPQNAPFFRTIFQQQMEPLALAMPLGGVRFSKRKIPIGGAQELEIWLYQPAESKTDKLHPGLLQIYGGGYLIGSPAMLHELGVHFASEGIVVVAPYYRNAPENPYPIPVEDCYAALQWLHNSASELNVDTSRLAVTGPSAGGGLAAAVALLARDRKEIKLVHQFLVYPMLDDRTAVREPLKTVGQFVWDRKTNKLAWEAYLGKYTVGAEDVPIYAAAARAPSLEGLPPTTIIVGSLDLFLEEDIEYAKRLIGDGVPTELRVIAGAPHGWDFIEREATSAKEAHQYWKSVLKKALLN